jgi:MFS family permease
LVRLLRRPHYPGFALTVALSRTSGAMFNTAAVLLVLVRTGSAATAGVTAAAAVLPGALSAPLLGAWLDAARRRRVLIVTDQIVATIGLLTMVALAGHAPNWVLPLAAILCGVTAPFSLGGFYSAMSEIAGPELLDEASRIDATSLNLSVIVGPSLAGVLAGVLGAAAAIEIEAAITLVVAGLVAANPAFELRQESEAPESTRAIRQALRTGARAIGGIRELRTLTMTSCLANFGWGLMMVAFPLYAVRLLHAHTHDAGYLWAALGVGSIAGTFLIPGRPSLRRIGASYTALAFSALVWPLAHVLALGVGLVALTGVIEGPAFSGSVAVRQRHAPAAIRAQVMTTMIGLLQITMALGSVVGGAIHDPVPTIYLLVAVNLLAGVIARGASRAR